MAIAIPNFLTRQRRTLSGSGDAPGLFGSQARPGMSGNNRVEESNAGFRHPMLHGAMGLFGSQARPGMTSSSSLGSLSGSSIGSLGAEEVPSAPQVTDLDLARAFAARTKLVFPAGMTDDQQMAFALAAMKKAEVTAAAGMTTQTKLLIAGGLVAAWWVFFRKK